MAKLFANSEDPDQTSHTALFANYQLMQGINQCSQILFKVTKVSSQAAIETFALFYYSGFDLMCFTVIFHKRSRGPLSGANLYL